MKTINKSRPGKKQAGFVMTSELILLSTVMVIGLVVGMVTMRDAVNAEMEDVAEAIGSFDQSYAFDGIQNAQGTAAIDGSGFVDAVDSNAGDNATFTFVATDFAETAAAIGSASTAAASPSAADGSLN